MASALFLARMGHRVTLFERFDHPEPVGSGLLIQPSGQAVLSTLGLLHPVAADGSRVNRLVGLSQPTGHRALFMEYRHIAPDAHAIGTHRADLFQRLYDAIIAEGVALECGHELAGADVSAAGVRPLFAGRGASNTRSRFDLLIDATGANSRLSAGQGIMLRWGALWASIARPDGNAIAADALEQRYRNADHMAGIMPIGRLADGTGRCALFWSVRDDRVDALRQAGMSAWQKSFAALWPEAAPFAEQLESFEQMTFARYRHRTAPPSPMARIAHVGDSWHSTSPQLGQGANMALIDAAALAQSLQMTDDLAEALRYYAHYRSLHVRLYQALSTAFTPLYQSDSGLLPVIRDRLVHHFAHWPLARALVAKIVSGHLGGPMRGIVPPKT